MTRGFAKLVGFCSGLLIAWACGGRNQEPDPNSETHWLAPCTSDSECVGAGWSGSCLCGICTIACQFNADCAHVPGGTCGVLPSCQSSAGSRICGPQVQNDGGGGAPITDAQSDRSEGGASGSTAAAGSGGASGSTPDAAEASAPDVGAVDANCDPGMVISEVPGTDVGAVDADGVCQLPLAVLAPLCPATVEQARCAASRCTDRGCGILTRDALTHYAPGGYNRCTYGPSGQLVGVWAGYLIEYFCGNSARHAKAGESPADDPPTPLDQAVGIQHDSYGRCYDAAALGAQCAPTLDEALCSALQCTAPMNNAVSSCANTVALTIGWLGGSLCYYDKSSHLLIGKGVYSDIPDYCNRTDSRSFAGRVPIEVEAYGGCNPWAPCQDASAPNPFGITLNCPAGSDGG
jgi:hypothetical protein